MGILALSTLVVIGTGFYLFSRNISGMRPGDKKLLRELAAIREEVLNNLDDLAPLRKEDMELLAAKEINKKTKKGFTANFQGVFTTIFEEPAIAYYYRRFRAKKRDGLLFAKTQRHEFTIQFRNNDAEVVVDNQPLGLYEISTGILFSGRTKKMIAKLDRGGEELMPMIIQGKDVGKMNKLGKPVKDALSQRVFEYVKNDLSPEEEAIVLTFAVIELVLRTVEA